MSFFLTFTYLTSFVLVTKPWSMTNVFYFGQLQTVGLTVFGIMGGIIMRLTRRYKVRSAPLPSHSDTYTNANAVSAHRRPDHPLHRRRAHDPLPQSLRPLLLHDTLLLLLELGVDREQCVTELHALVLKTAQLHQGAPCQHRHHRGAQKLRTLSRIFDIDCSCVLGTAR